MKLRMIKNEIRAHWIIQTPNFLKRKWCYSRWLQVTWHKFFLFSFYIHFTFFVELSSLAVAEQSLRVFFNSLFFFFWLDFWFSLVSMLRNILSQKPYPMRFPLLDNVEIRCPLPFNTIFSFLTIGFILSFSFFP